MEITVKEIIKLVSGTLLKGDLNSQFIGFGALNEASADEVSFLGNEKYYLDFLKTKAGLVLVDKEVDTANFLGHLIVVENPSYAFAQLVKHFVHSQKQFVVGVHPSAVIEEDVKCDFEKVCIKAGVIIESGVTIEEGSTIGSGVVIEKNVTIGKDCFIHSKAVIREGSKIGKRVILQSGCVIGSDGFGYELVNGTHQKVDQVGIVRVENDVEIGANSTIDRARFGETIIGEGSKIDNLVQIAHNVKIGKHCIVVSQSGIAGSTELGNYVTMAAQSGTAGHLKIGDQAILMARSGVTKNIPGKDIYKGFPARTSKVENKQQAALARLPKLIQKVKDIEVNLS